MGLSKVILYGADEDVGKWVQQRIGLPMAGTYRAIGLTWNDGTIIGGAVYSNYCGGGISIAVAGVTGWLTRRFIRAALAYPFLQLKVRRLTAYVATRNTTSQRLIEGVGFTRESVMERGLVDDDLIVYRMFNEDCKWI